MQQIATWVSDAGGVLHKRDLVARGATDRMLTAAVRCGWVRRARRGWYTTFPPADPRYEAVRVGGRVTGAALLALHGAWMWSTPPVAVVVPRNASRLRGRRGCVVIWRGDDTIESPADASDPIGVRTGSRFAVPLETALVDAVVRSPLDEAVALVDWALRSGLFTLDEVRAAFVRAPANAAGVVEWADPRSGSFIESIMRVTFVARGHRVESQVVVLPGDRRRIDLVIDGVAALELDGRAFHADTFEADRLKDLAITVGGRTALRASYSMVRDHRRSIVAAVDEVLARHRHRRRRSRRPRGLDGRLLPRRTTGLGRRSWRLRAPVPVPLGDGSSRRPAVVAQVRTTGGRG